VILRLLKSSASGAILATLLLIVALVFRPVSAEVALDAYILALAAIVLFHLVSAATHAEPGSRRSLYDQALEVRPVEIERPQTLTRLEREVALGVDTAFYAHYRLRPLLREIADHRLASRFSSGVERPTRDARASLPEDAWALFEPDRKPPRDPHAPGFGRERLAAIVDALEKIEA
jgi:hypothetical protein